jgi:hypothetical protein
VVLSICEGAELLVQVDSWKCWADIVGQAVESILSMIRTMIGHAELFILTNFITEMWMEPNTTTISSNLFARSTLY